MCVSRKSFTFYEIKLLNKNLNFPPKPESFKNDINSFIRKVKVNTYFKNKEQDMKSREFRISRNKTCTLNENYHTLEAFTEAFQNDLLKEEKNIKQIPYKDLSRKEESSLQNLSK